VFRTRPSPPNDSRFAPPTDWKSVDFLFQLTDDEVRTAANQQFDFASGGAFNGAIINSYLFIAIELKGNHYSRSALAGITREVNKLFDMPVLILFRHGDSLTLAVINRRLHKKEPGKDVLEKVTLIQDIQIANTHRAHIDNRCPSG
jgi:adenine-specific DNA-methyltransferase